MNRWLRAAGSVLKPLEFMTQGGRPGLAEMTRGELLRLAGMTRVGLLGLAVIAAAAGCGARTGLALEAGEEGGSSGGGSSGGGGSPTGGLPDAGHDVDPDSISKQGCSDASEKVIYLVSVDGRYFSFAPDTAVVATLGLLPCFSPTGATPFSMAVDRKATAYVVYSDGELFRVKGSPLLGAPLTCEPLAFSAFDLGISTFGMGFSTDLGGPSEHLFVASTGYMGDSPRLGVIDTTTLAFSLVGDLPADAAGLELTGTGDGRLFGFFGGFSGTGASGDSFFVEIDKKTAALGPKTVLPGVDLGQGWAFSFWGGDFLFFTSPGGLTQIHRYHSATGTLTLDAVLDAEIVGAGASTCAPAQ
jgi:hypothetical protein